jgi:hypothetical protein
VIPPIHTNTAGGGGGGAAAAIAIGSAALIRFYGALRVFSRAARLIGYTATGIDGATGIAVTTATATTATTAIAVAVAVAIAATAIAIAASIAIPIADTTAAIIFESNAFICWFGGYVRVCSCCSDIWLIVAFLLRGISP